MSRSTRGWPPSRIQNRSDALIPDSARRAVKEVEFPVVYTIKSSESVGNPYADEKPPTGPSPAWDIQDCTHRGAVELRTRAGGRWNTPQRVKARTYLSSATKLELRRAERRVHSPGVKRQPGYRHGLEPTRSRSMKDLVELPERGEGEQSRYYDERAQDIVMASSIQYPPIQLPYLPSIPWSELHRPVFANKKVAASVVNSGNA
ncbi:hypothetical protein FB451DRAFT_1201387 [Mycena latifolia]|nr:hypothetical protein FB451DRAFT_1201387 [Mycena latifolia]